MKRLTVAVLLACVAPLKLLACEMTELGFLAADETLHYEFTQTKTVAALANALVSTGVLGLSANKELVWQTLRPLKSTLVIDADGISQFNRKDERVNELANPVATQLAQVFLSVLSGNTAALETAFTQTLICGGSNWQLNLVPTDNDLTDMLESLTLNGAEHIDKISFREARGDYTEIVLSAPLTGPIENLASYLGD